MAGVHHRQAVQPKTQNLGCSHVSPSSQECAARRFLFKNPKTSTKWGVASDSSPARRFLEKFQKCENYMK